MTQSNPKLRQERHKLLGGVASKRVCRSQGAKYPCDARFLQIFRSSGAEGVINHACCCVFLLLLAFAFTFAVSAETNRIKPDILLIMPDQMRGDCLSALHHPVVRTPTLDKLAREGTLFRRAYSTCPSCIPARFSLLTGLYPSTSGVVGFKGKPITYPTLPKMLANAG